MSPPSHIVAPLIGFATTAAAVIAMSSVVSPLLHGPEPTGRSLSAGSATVTLSPPLRERAPFAQPAPREGGGPAAGGLLFASAPAVDAAPDLAAPPAPAPAAGPDTADQAEEGAGPASGRPDGLEREGTAVAGEIDAGAPPSAPLSPVSSAPTTTTVELPSGTVTPDGPARRFELRVVGLDHTDTEVRVRVAIAPGPDQPATATMTIALKPTSLTDAEGQAVKVSLDVISGDEATPLLRVRVSLVEDTSGEASAVANGDNGTSNVLDISVPVTAGDPVDHPAPEEPAGAPAELLLTLDPVESSTGSASAAPTVSVTVSVVPDPEPAPDPPAAELTAPTDGPDGPPAPEAATERTPAPDTAASAPEPEAASPPAPADEPDAAALAPAPAPAPEPAPAAVPEPASAPVPEPAPAPAQEPAPQPAAAPVAEPAPSGVAPPAEPAPPAAP